jgi:hypothetical protein
VQNRTTLPGRIAGFILATLAAAAGFVVLGRACSQPHVNHPAPFPKPHKMSMAIEAIRGPSGNTIYRIISRRAPTWHAHAATGYPRTHKR